MSPRQRTLLCGACLLVLALELPALVAAVGDGLRGPWAPGGARDVHTATLAPANGASAAPEAALSRLAVLALAAEPARD